MTEHRSITIVDRLRKANKISNVLVLGEDKPVEEISRTPVGIYGLDSILGGGLPYGRMFETIGDSSSGKTTLSLEMIRGVQEAGGVCAFIDSEHALDVSWAEKIGVDVKHLLIQQPDNGEQAIETMIVLAEYLNPGDLIILDSVAALVPKAELEGEVADAPMAGQARLVSKAMRLLVPAISKSGVMINWINQYRAKFNASSWGVQKKGAGGDALPFFCSIRMEVSNLGKIKEGEDVIGQKSRVKTIKNKTFAPFKEFDGEIRFQEGGFAKKVDIMRIALDRGLITKKGAWFNYGEIRIGQGKENAITYLNEHPEILEQINQQIKDGVVG